MVRKNSPPPVPSSPADRPRALDLLGFSSQLVFNTFHNRRLHDWEHVGDLDFAYGVARAHNRGMLEFCSVDARLLAACYVPLADFGLAAAMAAEAIEDGAGGVARGIRLPEGTLTESCGLDPVWAQAQEAGIPVVFHVGGTGDCSMPTTSTTGSPCHPTSTAGRRIPLRRLHGDSWSTGAEASPP